MLHFNIPGRGDVRIAHLLLDFNGTLAKDGVLKDGVAQLLVQLSGQVSIQVVTSDTNGTVAREMASIPCRVVVLHNEAHDRQKEQHALALKPEGVVAIGNGFNDRLMMRAADIAIATIQEEGASSQCLMQAHVVCTSITDALGLLLNPHRLVATLRS